MKKSSSSTSTTRLFARLNWLAATVFMISCLLLLQFQWRNSRLNAHQPLLFRLSNEPRVMLYFFICFASVTWLVGFFSLGFVQFELGSSISPRSKTEATSLTKKEHKKPLPSTANITPAVPKAKLDVAILGGTGLVGRALAVRLANHPTLRLGFLIGSPDTAGKPIKQVWERKEAILQKQYGSFWEALPFPDYLEGANVASFEEIFDKVDPNKTVIISCVAPALGWMEDRLIASKFDVFSISPHARTRPGVPLVVPEVNGITELKELQKNVKGDVGRLIKSPNCVSCGVCLVLDAVRTAYGGLKEVSITTFQSLSGRGDALYDRDLVTGNILPLGRTEEDTNRKIREEVIRVLGEPDLPISVTAQRVFTQRGHFVDVRVKTLLPVPSETHAALALERYSPFAGTPFGSLPDAPSQGPIRVSLEPKWPRPVQCVALGMREDHGMTVHVGQLSTDDRVFDLTFSFVVDNVARGAYGAALLTAEVFSALEEAGGK